MTTFTPDTATTLAPSGNWMSLRRPLNRRTNSGWIVAKFDGVCSCGKRFIVGCEVALCHGKISGCYWCCRDVKPTGGDVAAFAAWRSEVLAQSVQESVRAYVATIPATYREMVAVVSFVMALR